MIQLTEMFNMVGTDGCSDVATSLVMQGVEPEISIPIYDIFFLKLMPGQKSTFLAESIPEFNAIRQLSVHCGAVAASDKSFGYGYTNLSRFSCNMYTKYRHEYFHETW